MASRFSALAGFLALILAPRGEAMSFSALRDNPLAWGCPHLLVIGSTLLHGDELVIPPEGIDEVEHVPWDEHFETRVRVRLGVGGGDLSHALPLSVDALRTFAIAGVDSKRNLNQTMRRLRAEARAKHRHYWQVVAIAGPSEGRKRVLIRPPIDFSDKETLPQRLEESVVPFFTEGGGLRENETVSIFVLSADEKDGLPPTLDELGYINAIYRFALSRLAQGEPDRFPGRRLVILVKVTSTPSVPDILFAYDPWEDDRRVWEPTTRQRPAASPP